MTWDISNLIYTVICTIRNEEYIEETGEGKTRVRDRVRVYWQHFRQTQMRETLLNLLKRRIQNILFLQTTFRL